MQVSGKKAFWAAEIVSAKGLRQGHGWWADKQHRNQCSWHRVTERKLLGEGLKEKLKESVCVCGVCRWEGGVQQMYPLGHCKDLS